jgi:hypothetical protein
MAVNTDQKDRHDIEETSKATQSSEKVQETLEVDSINMLVTEGVRFMYRNEIKEYRKGQEITVPKELRDILLKRRCAELRV